MIDATETHPVDPMLRRATWLAAFVTVAAFLGLALLAAGSTDSWPQAPAMVAVIVALGLAAISVPINLGILAAALLRRLREPAPSMKSIYLYLGFAAAGYGLFVALLVLD